MSIRYMVVSAAILSGGIIVAGTPAALADTAAGDAVAQQDQVEQRMQQLFQNRDRQRIHQGDGQQGSLTRQQSQTQTQTQTRTRSMSGSNGGGRAYAGGGGQGKR